MDSQGLVAFVGRVHGRTYKAVELLTDGALRWRPREGEFSAGEIALHIANSRLMTLGVLMGSGSHYRGHSLRQADTHAEVRQAALRSSKKVIANLSDMDLDVDLPWGASAVPTPRWNIVLGALIEHEVHHRSQLCSYLAELGIQPPALHGVHVEELPR